MGVLIYEQERSAVIGAAIEVHRVLGAGFLEAIYQEALEIELTDRSVPFVSQKELVVFYKGRPLKKRYVADFICSEAVLVEIKAIDKLTPRDMSQAINYLKATGLKVCLLINFGSHGKLEFAPVVL